MKKQYVSDEKHVVNLFGIRWVQKRTSVFNDSFAMEVAYKAQSVVLIYKDEKDRDSMYDQIIAGLKENGVLL